MRANTALASIGLAVAATISASTQAALVFDNYVNAGTYIDTVNSGSNNVRWYAVYTANASNLSTLNLSQLRVRLYKPAGYTGGVTLEAFVAIANGADLSTAFPTLLASGATAPVYASLGTIAVSSSGGVNVNSTATWGTGATTLASVALNNSWSGNGALFVGFRFSNQSATAANQVALRLSTGSSASGGSPTAPAVGYIDNAYWRTTGGPTGSVGGPFSFNNSLYSNVAAMDLNGTLVPSPGAAALVGIAGLVGARRRRG